MKKMNKPFFLLWVCLHQCLSEKPWERACSVGCDVCYVGICQQCKDGYYGYGCTSRCNDRCRQDGSCQGKRCTNGCPYGRYGYSCEDYCLGCSSYGCDQSSGTCIRPTRRDNYDNDDDDSDVMTNKYSTLLKTGAAIVCFIVIMCVVAAYCRRKEESKTDDEDDVDNAVVHDNNDAVSEDSASSYGQSRRHYDGNRYRETREETGRRHRDHSEHHSHRDNRDYRGYRHSDNVDSSRHSPRTRYFPTVLIEEPVDEYLVPSAPAVPVPPPAVQPPPSPPPPPQYQPGAPAAPPPSYSSLFPGS